MNPTKMLAFFFLLLGGTAIGDDESIKKAAAKVDSILESYLKNKGLKPNAPINDEVFLRRIYLNLAGRIPTASEAVTFLESKNPEKRHALINSLLSQESFVSHFYNFWADVLRYKSHYVNRANVIEAAYSKFIRESIRTNKPFDKFVFELLSAKGYAWENGAIGYYHRDPEMPLDNMAITSRIFLGTRIECAQCHDHPFDKWKQTQFYHLAAYTYGNKPVNEAFGGARDAIRDRQQVINDDFKREKAASNDGGKAAELRKNQRLEAMEYRKIVGIIKGPVGQLLSPIGLERKSDSILKLPHDFKEGDGKPFEVMKPASLMGPEASVEPEKDSAEVFARWVTSPENPRFTKVIVNRLWKIMFGVALNEPLDDLRDSSKAMVPALEENLENLMITLNYDMRAFIAVVANTKAYQSAATTKEFNQGDTYDFQGPLLRRMTAEQIWDSIIALANHEPDSRNLQREQLEERRINISKMVCEAYLNFDGQKLVDMAYARLQAEKELEKQEKIVQEALIVANRNGDKAKETELRRKQGALAKERAESFVRDFIMPVLENLVEIKAGKNAKLLIDQNYKVNPNPRVLAIETWRRLYAPGYGPPPKTTAQLNADAKAQLQHFNSLANKLGYPAKDHPQFVNYCQKAGAEWLRASELDSPAPRGHFLRIMGQSDREFVENANLAASIPQALALMNSDIISENNLLSPFSPLMHFISQAKSPSEKSKTVYLATLSRLPTPDEVSAWNKAAAAGLSINDLVYALLNSKQFLFIQ